MFTGIVEETGIIKKKILNLDGMELTIHANKVLEDLKVNDSISCSGICLTVTKLFDTSFVVQLVEETIDRTTAKFWNVDSEINLERLKFQFDQEKLNLENTVYQAYNDLVGAIKLYEASNKTVKSLRSAFEDATDRYLLGSLNSFDFIQSKQAFEASVSENIRAKFDYIFRLKVLEFYFGLPLSVPQ